MRAPGIAAMASVVLVTAAIVASAAVQWTTQTSITTSVLTPPVYFGLGSNADNDRWLSGSSVSTNKTSFNATVVGRSGGDVTVKDVVRLSNDGASAQTVTLRAAQVADSQVVIYTWTVKDGSQTLATLNMLGASPSASFELPPDEYKLDLRLKLAKGASAADTAYSAPLWLEIG